ncbi:protein RKD2-like [Salvia splendens]|uniref:protein RKD2-like n=1 Tax=Salvia splendens TaxID=180675 RepID=UPI001C27BD28|nr:protein RKD2-like [Salvia splendens]
MASTGIKFENHNELGFFFHEEPITPLVSWEQQFASVEGFNLGLHNFLEYEPFPLGHQSSNLELTDFDDFSGDLWVFDDHPLPLHNNIMANPNPNPNPASTGQGFHTLDSSMQIMVAENQLQHSNEVVRRSVRHKSSALQLEEIQKYFDYPITRAAKELNVGLTVLKKRCRELHITRWPHRKIKSLKSLIHNVKELGLTNEIEMLEEHKKMVEMIPEMELTERTKKLRQACFKANYKKRKSFKNLLEGTKLHHF